MPNKKIKNFRPDKNAYYINIAKEVASRSTCMSTHIGAIIVKNDQIIATGYNGAPRKTKDCYERGFCLRRELKIPSGQYYEICRSVHAEQNAIINAARSGVNILGGDMYSWGMKVWAGANELLDILPCYICKKMILNSGLNSLYYMSKSGKIIKIDILKNWTKDWQKRDMLDDMKKYSTDYSKEYKKIEISKEKKEKNVNKK